MAPELLLVARGVYTGAHRNLTSDHQECLRWSLGARAALPSMSDDLSDNASEHRATAVDVLRWLRAASVNNAAARSMLLLP